MQAIYLAAVMEAQAGHFDVADKDLEKIAGFIGRIQRAFYLQAVVKEQLGQYEQAEEAARKYLARFPNDISGYKVLARVQFAKKRPDLVIDTLGKVAESGKGDAETYDLSGPGLFRHQPCRRTRLPRSRRRRRWRRTTSACKPASPRRGWAWATSMPRWAIWNTRCNSCPKAPAVGEALFFASLASGDMDKAAEALAKVKAMQGDTAVTGNLEGLLHLAKTELPEAQATFEA